LSSIILSTLNARYSHTSIALRYLYANLNELQEETKIMEFVINENIQTIAEKILDKNPKIVGFGVYIWNADDICKIVEVIKNVSPETIVVLGGPEVSYLPLRVNFDLADFIIKGEAEISFYNLCKDILENKIIENRFIDGQMIDTKDIKLPYEYYDENDIRNRKIYIESSRGCPFKCEFCLSSIDKKVRYFDDKQILEQLEILWQKGVRDFKFMDRTFNLNMKYATQLLDFFLSKEPPFFVHFEVIPDTFPKKLREKLEQFPAMSLQLEIGIQTLQKDIAKNIKRNLNIEKIKDNITFLENNTKAHMHLDLIVGLPNESLEQFADNLNNLYSISHSEIQIGILKKLSGTTLNRHDEVYGMVYSQKPPYDILKNNLLSFKQIQQMKRFSRFWDLVYNSGNFSQSIKLLFDDDFDIFNRFMNFSNWIYSRTQSTYKIGLDRLQNLMFEYLTNIYNFDEKLVAQSIMDDIIKVKGRKIPKFLQEYIKKFDIVVDDTKSIKVSKQNKRQMKS
jgi:radical SAM superfamily enzyme YgiQ (UPF0313 family)